MSGENTGRYGRVNPGQGFGQQYDYTANAVLTESQDGALITNIGAVAAITVTLPAATAGREFAVMRVAAYSITVTATGTDDIRDGPAGGSYVLNTRELTVFSCIVDGTWELVLGGAYIGRYNVRDFGAVGNGVADDTAAAQAAYDACPVGGWVVWPTGTYKITAQLNLRKSFVTTEFQGGGEDGGVNLGTSTGTGCCILHLPTAAGTLFDIANAAPSVTQLNSPSFYGNALIYSTDTTYSKTAFKFSNVSRPYFAGRIHIAGPTGQGSQYKGSSGGAGGSVGVYTLGREQYNYDNMLIYAQVPLRFGKNPDNSGYDMDHVYLSNAILSPGAVGNAPSTLPHTCILIDDDVRISVATFEGHLALVAGMYKLYWAPADLNTSSGRLTFRNFLTEQGTDSSKYSFHIAIDDASSEILQNLTLENGILGVDQNGVYTKNVHSVFLRGVTAEHTTGQKMLKCEGTHSSGGTLSVGWDDLRVNPTSPENILELPSDMQLSLATQTSYGDNRHFPHTARYAKGNDTDGVSQNPHFRSGQTDRWSRYGTLADAATWTLPLSKRYQGMELADIAITAKGNAGTCTFAVATPGVVTFTAHGFQAGKTVKFFTTSALPAALTANTIYYVLALTADTFNVEATLGGGAIAFADTGTGTHTCAGATDASGDFTVSAGGGVVKKSGPSNVVVGAPGASQLGLSVVTGQTGMDYCTLVSDANETLRVLVEVKMYRSQWN